MKKKPPLKLYTKTGDQGTSSTLSGRFAKDHSLFEVVGTLDELNATLGLVAVIAETATKKELLLIQNLLLVIGAVVSGSHHVKLKPNHVTFLEKRIDFYQSHSGKQWLTSFILPGGIEVAARLDLARTICRRLERLVVTLSQNQKIDPLILKYLNRLSDYLYALRCHLNYQDKYKEIKFNSSEFRR